MADEHVVVVDIGSASVKGGFSGDDVPSIIFPSALTAWPKYTEAIENSSDGYGSSESNNGDYSSNSSVHPIQRGVVKDWEQLSKLWQVIIDEVGIVPDTTSIMLAESPLAAPSDRAKWAEILFETYHVPSMCIGNSSSLCVFASGRTTGVAVDCGAGVTCSVPVFEGLALKHAQVSMEFGGQDVSSSLRKYLAERNIHVSLADARLIKQKNAFVHGTFPGEAPIGDQLQILSLPDGTDVEVESRVLSDCCEGLFQNDKSVCRGLVGQVYESITLCDDSLKVDCTNNVIIAGGSSMLTGLGDRLSWELSDKLTANMPANATSGSVEARVIPNSYYREYGYTSQRKIAGWIGGSIIGSLDTYKDLKITRQEWEEGADSSLQTKCF